MGYSIAWNATRGLAQDVVLARQGFSLTDERLDYPESPVAGRASPSGWYLVVADRCDHAIVRPRLLETLSHGCEVLACSVEEHVMVCFAELWIDGRRSWRVEHDAQVGLDHLAVTGTPPAALHPIVERCTRSQQAASGEAGQVDYFFDIPLELAKTLVGYRHDDAEADEPGTPFTVLRETALAPLRDPWWKFWR